MYVTRGGDRSAEARAGVGRIIVERGDARLFDGNIRGVDGIVVAVDTGGLDGVAGENASNASRAEPAPFALRFRSASRSEMRLLKSWGMRAARLYQLGFQICVGAGRSRFPEDS